ncbi:MAG: hypothetical protein LQ349_007726 [Xanthoria aureola]|nr:MAG: hypothetical protein LQ349_007726 [Xanthoria aureola]
MDPQSQLASREDVWRLQNEMKNVYATQAEHADRIMRLERHHAEDSRMKSVWGGQSPFPSILNGSAQQDQGYNPAAEAFKNFDQDQTTNLLGSLHLDSEDEPRRGASRANSVRFDESALHGQFGHNSRSSTDFLPLRTGSGLGGHALTERSSSHKSDGRLSSAGQSTHSARASSLVLESRPLSATVPPFVPAMGPPPGLFILGPVPSIIRCWLNTNFSNDSLLYAAVCTGSYKSVISLGMISQLGLQDQIHVTSAGQQSIKLSVYLPEATIQQPSSRSNSPAAQLPTLTVDFAVQNPSSELNGLQIFLGCDVLRARNADIHFSLDRLTLYDDDRNKLSVPLVRPENAALFQNLQTINVGLHGHQVLLPEREQNQPIARSRADEKPTASTSEHAVVTPAVTPAPPSSTGNGQTPVESPISSTTKPSVIGQGRKVIEASNINEGSTAARDDTDIKDTESLANGSTPDTPTRSDNGNIWGSWRRDSTQGARPDVLASSANSSSGYQRAGRGRGMKVLKPARLNTTRSSSTTQPSSGFDSTPGRFNDVGKWPSPTTSNENQDPRDRRFSGGAKSPLPTLTGKPSKSNPVGGASAFGWLNAAQQKQPDASAE